MREMAVYPYPSAAPDAALFEDVEEGYVQATDAVPNATPSFVNPKQVSPAKILLRLARAGKYEDASRVYEELVEMDVNIPPHPVFHFPALAVLSDTSMSPHARADCFIKWWSLVPPISRADSRRSVRSVLYELLQQDAIPDVALIARFALLAASKGYAQQVAVECIPLIARYTDPTFARDFVENLCVREWELETSQGAYKASHVSVAQELRSRFEHWYSIAIQTMRQAGDFRGARQAFELALERGRGFENTSYADLVRRLGREKDAQGSEEVQALLAEDVKRLSTKRVRIARLENPNARAMARSVKQLKEAFRDARPLSAFTLASLIDLYLSKGRSSLVRRLRTRAYKYGNGCIYTWILAEMICYARAHNLPSLLSVYERHFYLVGVPSRLFSFETAHRLRPAILSNTRCLHPLDSLGPHPPLQRRLSPTHHHLYVLWLTATRGIRRPAALVHLYHDFIEILAASRGFHDYPLPRLLSSSTPRPADEKESYSKAKPSMVSDHFFKIFFSAFYRFKFRPFATKAVIDMFRLGLKPSPGTQATFMMCLRLPSDPHSVGELLDYWEEQVDQTDVPRKRVSMVFKQSLLSFFYRATLRRLMEDGRHQDALYVAERYMRKVPTEPTKQFVSIMIAKIKRSQSPSWLSRIRESKAPNDANRVRNPDTYVNPYYVYPSIQPLTHHSSSKSSVT